MDMRPPCSSPSTGALPLALVLALLLVPWCASGTPLPSWLSSDRVPTVPSVTGAAPSALPVLTGRPPSLPPFRRCPPRARRSLSGPTAPTQDGFLSVDTGYTGQPYVSQVNGLSWQPDTAYAPAKTPSGVANWTIPGYPAGAVIMEASLRYFSKAKKPCYSLRVAKPGRYLVRLTFWYNNYDGKNAPPTFNLTLGITQIVTLQMDSSSLISLEAVMDTSSDSILVCLVRVKGNPIINGIELRPLPSASYNQIPLGDQNLLLLWHRFSCGTIYDVQYPDDPYDRKWSADDYFITSPASSASPVYTSTGADVPAKGVAALNAVPSFVFGKDRYTNTDGTPLEYTFPGQMFPVEYLTYLYVANIWPNRQANNSFVMDISMDSTLVAPGVDVYETAGNSSYSGGGLLLEYYDTKDPSLKLTLAPNNASAVQRPILSGLELYSVMALSKPVPYNQVHALLSFKLSAGSPSSLSDWTGDPCSPVTWAGLQCSFTPTNTSVTAMFLSGFNLTGLISPSLVALDTLRTIRLDNNHLSGTIPAGLFDLPHLTTLNVANNSLFGAVPSNLPSNLTFIAAGNSYLCTTDPSSVFPTCPLALPPGTVASPPPSQPTPITTPPSTPYPSPSGSSSTALIVGLVVGIVAGAAVAIALVLLVLRYYMKRGKAAEEAAGKPGMEPFSGDDGAPIKPIDLTAAGAAAAAGGMTAEDTLQKQPLLDLLVGCSVQQYKLTQVEEATNNFSPGDLIGSGGFGPVFRGMLPDGRMVAVKKRDGDSLQGEKEFFNEVQLLSRAHHTHLVELIGLCHEQGQQILVYEFMPNGTVRDHLYDAQGAPVGHLRWLQRLTIALGAARGIGYLHNTLTPSIIHRDIKTSNILLDANLVAKVADFGLSRLKTMDQSHVSTNVKGTAGYLDPEYYTLQQLTDKSDVFSFGVVLLELISGRQPINLDRPRPEWSIIDWARAHLQSGNILAIVDPTLKPGEYLLDAMWKVAEVGILCVEPMGLNRPSIADVVKELEEAVSMEVAASESRDSSCCVSDGASLDLGGPRGVGKGMGGMREFHSESGVLTSSSEVSHSDDTFLASNSESSSQLAARRSGSSSADNSAGGGGLSLTVSSTDSGVGWGSADPHRHDSTTLPPSGPSSSTNPASGAASSNSVA